MFQSRRSLLTWKLFGTRLDGWSNDDFPTFDLPMKANSRSSDTGQDARSGALV